ncbi:hypothetical protein HHK36_003348 [Tetracentron sinense]|uniref:Uncharacterized protein n=1 Tax=Tetracentron sinense TaxID=13715 RepID=A0A834ZXH2_TETSI|nr:hypothetical protein HHK36_003348 [Tetracentron sinense]
MAKVLNLKPPNRTFYCSISIPLDSAIFRFCKTLNQNQNPKWASLQQKLKCRGRYSCLFSDNRKEEQARKSLESALGGKREEFEKWNKEIQKREEVGGGGDAGGGGWFGWFGGPHDDNFWQEAQQASLAILGIIFMYLVIAKGEVMLAVIFNPLLFALRGTRNGFTFITSRMLRKFSPASSSVDFGSEPREEVYKRVSAKDSVVRKWGSN